MKTDLSTFDLHCPYCCGKIKAVDNPDATPAKGDFFVCRCGDVSVLTDHTMFSSKWCLRRPTKSERAKIAEHAEVAAILDKLHDEPSSHLSVL